MVSQMIGNVLSLAMLMLAVMRALNTQVPGGGAQTGGPSVLLIPTHNRPNELARLVAAS